jgi:hypothetical protein
MEVEKMEVEIKKINNEDIKKLIDDVIKNPEKYDKESKYLLEVETFTIDSGEFPHYKEFEVIKGNPEIIELDKYVSFDMRYETFLIIPRETGTIVKTYEYQRLSDFETEEIENYYIFTRNGWVSIQVR